MSKAARSQGGMTLIEVMIAASIFTVLGGTLILLLSRGVQAWRVSEARREAYEEAQAVLRQVRGDLRNAFATNPDVRGREAKARLLVWFDARGQQRLCLVRTIAAESRHPLAHLAGTQLGATAEIDGEDDWQQAQDGELKATGGLMEVVYAMAPGGGDVLLRGVRSPAGGARTLFDPDRLADADVLGRLAKPLSSRVLYLGFELWSARTTAWDATGAEAPVLAWDSTRGLLDPDLDLAEGERWLYRQTPQDPDDDIFPERILVTLVVEEDAPAGPWTMLTAPLPKGADRMTVEGAAKHRERLPWVRVGREWMRCRYVSDTVLEVELRGGRGTLPEDHPAGTAVVTGRTFHMVVELPAAREPWNEMLGLADE